MKRCRACKHEMVTGTAPVTIEFGGRVYTRDARALLCKECGDEATQIHNSELERAELAVARRIAHNGEATAEAFRFMRRTLGYTAEELAALLGVTPGSIGRWERKEHELPRTAWLALTAMVEDKLAGREEIYRIAEAAEHPHEEHGRIQLEAVG